MSVLRRGARSAVLAVSLGLLAVSASSQEPRVPRFTDVTGSSGIDFVNISGPPPGEKGYMTETIGAGAAWLDYDGDGKLDLYLLNGSTHERKPGQGEPNRLYRGDGKGAFQDVTNRAGLGDRGWAYGVAVGDYDNDGDPDIYVVNHGPNVLYRNNGDGTFTDVTGKAKVGDASWGTSAAFFDSDADGDLDLYVANYVDFSLSTVPRLKSPEALKRTTCTWAGMPVFCGPMGTPRIQDVFYRNDGNGVFSDATRESGFLVDPPRYALGVVSGDFDNDGDTDLYVANDSVQNSLWRNRGDGTFEDIGLRTLSALDGGGRPQAGMGTDFGDYNNDGWLDIVVTNFARDLNTLYRNTSGKFFTDVSQLSGLGATRMMLSWGVGFHDFDLDGDLDLFIANGHTYPVVDDFDNGLTFKQPNQLFLNDGRRFVDVTTRGGPGLTPLRSFRGVASADYDDDGDVDLLVTAIDEGVLLLRNDTPRSGHYLQVRLIGTKSNRDGVGARVTVSAGGRRQIRERKGGGSYLSQSDPRLHFGLGSASTAEVLNVRWPSGQEDTLRNVATDSLVTVLEGQGLAP